MRVRIWRDRYILMRAPKPSCTIHTLWGFPLVTSYIIAYRAWGADIAGGARLSDAPHSSKGEMAHGWMRSRPQASKSGRWCHAQWSSSRQALGTSRDGLTAEEAARPPEKHGPNLLPEQAKLQLYKKVLDQFKNLFNVLLLVAAGLSFVSGVDGERCDVVPDGVRHRWGRAAKRILQHLPGAQGREGGRRNQGPRAKERQGDARRPGRSSCR